VVLDWGRDNFLHTSWYSAVFWVCDDENSVDNTGIF